jgi:hypothetical protein
MDPKNPSSKPGTPTFHRPTVKELKEIDSLQTPEARQQAAKQWSPDYVAEQQAKVAAQEISNEIGRQKVAQQKASLAVMAAQQTFWAAATELVAAAAQWLRQQ